MDFERARTKEQKDVRISEILESAMRQYHDMPYDKISLASISKDLSFSRVNLYKYFKTKEEIFLKILELDMYRWVDKLQLIYMGQPSRDVKHFADKWASALKSQKRMTELMTKLFSELEKNSSVEKLAEFKKSYFTLYTDIFAILSKQLPDLSQDQITDLLIAQNVFAMGLYPLSKPSENQIKAIELAGADYSAPDFVKTLSDFIVTYVKGLTA